MQSHKLSVQLQGDGTPFHMAVIMDGNSRWARRHGLPKAAGYRKGAEAVYAVVEASPQFGVTHLTLFALSTENWRRPKAEIHALLTLLRERLRSELGTLVRKGVRVRFIGDRSRLPADTVAMLETVERETRDNGLLNLTVALNYGGRQDIVGAAKALAKKAKAGTLDPEDLDEELFDAAVETCGLPDVDLLIRTGGEQRLSNFLLWPSAYAEFVFVDVLWPDFDVSELGLCIENFRGRSRRFGASSG